MQNKEFFLIRDEFLKSHSLSPKQIKRFIENDMFRSAFEVDFKGSEFVVKKEDLLLLFTLNENNSPSKIFLGKSVNDKVYLAQFFENSTINLVSMPKENLTKFSRHNVYRSQINFSRCQTVSKKNELCFMIALDGAQVLSSALEANMLECEAMQL